MENLVIEVEDIEECALGAHSGFIIPGLKPGERVTVYNPGVTWLPGTPCPICMLNFLFLSFIF